MIEDSDASHAMVDDERIPTPRENMRDCKKLKEPKTIVTAGNEGVFATATCTIWGYIIDQAGPLVPVRIFAIIVTGL